MNLSSAIEIVYQAIDGVNELRAADDQIPKEPDVKLAGDQGRLDSLGLITLTLSVERRVLKATSKSITILDSGDFDMDAAILSTPAKLAEAIVLRTNS